MGFACFQLFQEGEQNSHVDVDGDKDEADDGANFDGDGDNYDEYDKGISTGVN